MPPNRLDVYLGPELREWIDAESAASGLRPAEIVQSALREYRLASAETTEVVRRLVLAVAAAVEPSDQYDPEDDPRLATALVPLARLLGSLPAAEGIAAALTDLWTAQHLGGDDGR